MLEAMLYCTTYSTFFVTEMPLSTYFWCSSWPYVANMMPSTHEKKISAEMRNSQFFYRSRTNLVKFGNWIWPSPLIQSLIPTTTCSLVDSKKFCVSLPEPSPALTTDMPQQTGPWCNPSWKWTRIPKENSCDSCFWGLLSSSFSKDLD